jgi:hypothetical protein
MGILETAVRGSNAQYDRQEILDRLDIQIAEVHPTAISLSNNRAVPVQISAGMYFI